MVRASPLPFVVALPLFLASGEAGGVSCDEIEFSAEVLANYPNAREACQEVVTRDGIQYMQVRGEVGALCVAAGGIVGAARRRL